MVRRNVHIVAGLIVLNLWRLMSLVVVRHSYRLVPLVHSGLGVLGARRDLVHRLLRHVLHRHLRARALLRQRHDCWDVVQVRYAGGLLVDLRHLLDLGRRHAAVPVLINDPLGLLECRRHVLHLRLVLGLKLLPGNSRLAVRDNLDHLAGERLRLLLIEWSAIHLIQHVLAERAKNATDTL